MRAKTLAKRIAMSVTSYDHGTHRETVQRIALMRKEKDGTETNLGGLAYYVVEERILKELRKAGIP